MSAMLDLATRNMPNVINNHLRESVIPILVRNHTIFVFLSHLGPEIQIPVKDDIVVEN